MKREYPKHRDKLISEQREELNVLGSQLDKALRARLAKEDPAYVKKVLENRRIDKKGTPEEKRALALERMKFALHVGRDIRRHDREILDARIWNLADSTDRLGLPTTALEKELLAVAGSRDMREKSTVKGKDGAEKTISTDRVVTRDPYKKRPSVRALKKHRSKGIGGPSL